MALAWLSFGLATGKVIADLPTLEPEWPLRRSLSKYETATADLYFDGAPPNWQAATEKGEALLACYDEDDPARVFQWAGYVSERERDSDKESASLTLVTAEGYTDRRYVGDRTYANVDQGVILADLVNSFAAAGGALPGLPMSVELGDTGGTTRSFIFLDADNATLYSRLGQLSGILGGLEWLIDWRWNDAGDGVEAVLRASTRIGNAAIPGQLPAASFELGSGGSVIQAVLTESYADQMGANVVRTYSSGQGATSPTSGNLLVPDFGGRPAFELRYSPSASEIDATALKAYAQKALTLTAPGMSALTLKAALNDATRHGGDWLLGDDLSFNIDPMPAFPAGYSGIGRSIAYELSEIESDYSIAPILATTSLPSDGTDGSTSA